MAATGFSRLPGFRDFLPEDLAVRSHVFDAWRRVSRRYGFVEYDGPPLEPLELYVEKSGEEIVTQLYNFTDKGDRSVTLRPEMTPSLARILGERNRALPKPIRWFSVPQLFRYERQQRGRLREHFQWNVDIVGEESVAADAEILAVALDAMRELGLGADDICARVSDRPLLSALLLGAGVADEKLPAAFAVIDKLHRQSAERTQARLHEEVGLSAAAVGEVLDLLAAPGLDSLDALVGANEAATCELERLRDYFEALSAMGLGDFVTFDLGIVRGLAYYTGIVFELFDRRGELRAICGGGRYDRLLELVGGDPLPAVGFGMGDVVLTDVLRERKLLPDTGRSVDAFVVVVGEAQRALAQALAHALRDAGRSVVYALRPQAVRRQFKTAEAEGAREVYVLGPDEAEAGEVRVRSMATGAERRVPLSEWLGSP